jgi:RHS repeat-associated protein
VTKGTAPALNVTYDPATNRRTGECADANGNLCASGYSYDVENRLISTGSARYSYAPGNKRVWRGVWSGGSQTVDEVTYWGVNGQKLTTYSLIVYQQFQNSTPQLEALATGRNYYFGGKLVKNTGGYVTPDRLGSIGKYFPYGQERPSATTDGKEKFATYFRDSETGLDYAQNRYHQPGMGRFTTPDPLGAANSKNPGTWNQYAYTQGDPINNNDQTGHYPCSVGNGDHIAPAQCEDVSIYIYGNANAYKLLWDCYFLRIGCPGGWGGGGVETDYSGIQRASGAALGTSSAAALRAATSAQNAIANRTAWSGPCEQLLGAIGITSSAISSAAANASIYDGTSGWSGDLFYADLYLNTPQAAAAQAQYPNVTIAQFIANEAKRGTPVKSCRRA